MKYKIDVVATLAERITKVVGNERERNIVLTRLVTVDQLVDPDTRLNERQLDALSALATELLRVPRNQESRVERNQLALATYINASTCR